MKSAFTLTAVIIGLTLIACAGPQKAGNRRAEKQLAALDKATRAGRSAYLAGRFHAAAAHYERALELARLRDDVVAAPVQAYNVAVAQAALGRHDRALALLREARYRASDDRDLAYRIDLFGVEVLRSAKRTAEALDLLGEMQIRYPQRAPVLILRAVVLLDRGDLHGAAAFESLARSQARQEPSVSSVHAAHLLAALALERGEISQAIGHARTMITAARRIENPNRLADALLLAAGAYGRAARLDEARRHYYRAARCLQSQGRLVEALKAVNEALDLADGTGSPALDRDVWEDLLADIQRELRPADP